MTSDLITATEGFPAPPFAERRLVLPDGIPYDRWLAIGGALKHMEENVMWWIGDWWRYGEHSYGEMASQAAKSQLKDLTGFDYDTVNKAAWVAGSFEFIRRRINSKLLTFSHFEAVASHEMAREDQDDWLDRAELGDVDPETKEARPWSSKRLRAEVQSAKLHTKIVGRALPEGTFNLIYADPPWEYEFAATANRAIENQYPTMKLEDIRALGEEFGRAVKEVAAKDAILFMWTTSPKLLESLTVVEAWGFDYRTCMVWVKHTIGMGHYVRQRHELLLIAKRGDFPTPRDQDCPDSVIEAVREEHSRKPDEAYALIERMYPSATRLELFARREREGWASWGNQVGGA